MSKKTPVSVLDSISEFPDFEGLRGFFARFPEVIPVLEKSLNAASKYFPDERFSVERFTEPEGGHQAESVFIVIHTKREVREAKDALDDFRAQEWLALYTAGCGKLGIALEFE